jgi:phage tail tape-measure protein
MEFQGITSIDELIKQADATFETTGIGSTLGGIAGAIVGQFIPIPIVDDILLSWLGSKAGDWLERHFTEPKSEEEAKANLAKAKQLYEEEKGS